MANEESLPTNTKAEFRILNGVTDEPMPLSSIDNKEINNSLSIGSEKIF